MEPHLISMRIKNVQLFIFHIEILWWKFQVSNPPSKSDTVLPLTTAARQHPLETTQAAELTEREKAPDVRLLEGEPSESPPSKAAAQLEEIEMRAMFAAFDKDRSGYVGE